MNIVDASLATRKAPRFMFTIPAIKGFISEAPEYRMPIIVVRQSIEPIVIRSRLGNASVLIMFSPFFS
jgi:hypothetical protein